MLTCSSYCKNPNPVYSPGTSGRLWQVCARAKVLFPHQFQTWAVKSGDSKTSNPGAKGWSRGVGGCRYLLGLLHLRAGLYGMLGSSVCARGSSSAEQDS